MPNRRRETSAPGGSIFVWLALFAVTVILIARGGIDNAWPANSKSADEHKTEDLPICGPPRDFTSPVDYRTRNSTSQLRWGIGDVYRNHLGPAEERMNQGEYSQRVMADLDFLLRHWPNHLPGLEALVRYNLAGGKVYNFRPTYCYLEWAHEFAPDDSAVLLVEGYWFWKKKYFSKAITAYQEVLKLDPYSSDGHYNLGLLYFELGDYQRAVVQARAAYQGGYPLQGLKRKLRDRGYWPDQAPQGTSIATR